MKQTNEQEIDSEIEIGNFQANVRFRGVIVPIVLVMIIIFFLLTRNEILALSKERQALKSENYAEQVSAWTEQTLSELNIYRGMVEQLGLEDDRAYDILTTTYDTHDAYPLGLYMGDENGNYFDASGWEPDEDFVVTEREWYLEGQDHDLFTFGEPYLDALTGNTCVSATTKLQRGSVLCVMAADVYLDYAAELVKKITSESIDIAFFVSEGSRMILVDSDASWVGKTLSDESESLLYRNIDSLLDQGILGQSMLVAGEDGNYYVDINEIENTDWYFVTCVREREVLRDLRQTQAIMLLVAAMASGFLIVVSIKMAEEMSEVRARAKTDPLTGLMNQYGFREKMQAALADNKEQGVLLILDLDNFKLINDQLGHPEGDIVLKQFAGMLEDYFNRNKDIVSRIGGDEFAVYVGRNISRDEVNEMLRKFIGIVHQAFDEKYPEQKLSASIGGAFTADNNSYQELYQSADNALYEEKRGGKDGFVIL